MDCGREHWIQSGTPECWALYDWQTDLRLSAGIRHYGEQVDDIDMYVYHTRFESKPDECCTCNSKDAREGPRPDSCWRAPEDQCWAGNTQPPTGFSEKWRGSCLLERNTLGKLFHVFTNTMNQEHGDFLGKGGCRIQMQSCYLGGISSVPCFAASTLWSSIIFLLVSPSIIQRLIVFYALEKFTDTNELNCLAICRLHVI